MGASLRLMVFTTTHQHARNPEERLPGHWDPRFRRLDSSDGKSDGRIDRRHLIEWFAILDGHRNSVDFVTARRLTFEADRNDDGYIERHEFMELVTGDQEGNVAVRRYLRDAANAERYRWCPPPWFTILITLAQIAYFVYHIVHFHTHPDHQHDHTYVTWRGPYPKCSTLVFNPSRRHELWRFISYFLVHAGLEHLCINVFLQLMVGLLLEMSNGWVRVASIYLAGIMAGSLGAATFSPGQYLAGSSGAGFALVGAHLASLLLNWKEDRLVIRDRIVHSSSRSRSTTKAKVFRCIRLVFVLLLCLLDFCKPLYDNQHKSLEATTSYSAHLGGLVAGFLMGVMILRNRHVENWERVAKLACTVILCLSFFFTVFWNLLGNEIWRKLKDDPAVYYFNKETYNVVDGHHGRCNYEALRNTSH